MNGGVTFAVDLFYAESDPQMEGRSARERRIMEIGLGFARVLVVSDYIDRGAPDALSVAREFSMNYDIEFDANGLLEFLLVCFPDLIERNHGAKMLARIEPGRRYSVCTFDLS